MLHVVQGHPKLLELADAAAADRDRLDAQLAAAEEAAAGQGLEAFFRDGTSTLDPGQFLAALAAWTTTALAVLSPAARLLAMFLACLEDDDRQSGRDRGDLGGPVAAAGPARRPARPGPAARCARRRRPRLAREPAVRRRTARLRPVPLDRAYQMHPGVSAAIVTAAAPGVREAADAVLAAFWRASPTGRRSRRAGRTAAWSSGRGWPPPRTCCAAATGTPPAPCSSTPSCGIAPRGWSRRCCRRCGGSPPPPARPRTTVVLARALQQRWTRPRPSGCCAARWTARRAAAMTGSPRRSPGNWSSCCWMRGRLGEALEMAGQKAGYTRRAGLGPWTQLGDQARRLQVLGLMGEHEQVLAETEELRARMTEPARPPRRPGDRPRRGTSARPSSSTGRDSALALGRWQQVPGPERRGHRQHPAARRRGARAHHVPVQRRVAADPAGAAGGGRAAAAPVPAGLRGPRATPACSPGSSAPAPAWRTHWGTGRPRRTSSGRRCD